jgi:thiamine biosynthesis protein ThiI
MDYVIVRYGEIFLKGKNRFFFEKKLIKNIKDCFKKNKIGYKVIKRLRGRIIIETEEECHVLRNVFGIMSLSYAFKCKPNFDEIKKKSLLLIKDLKENNTFRITTNKLDKNVKIKSIDLNKELGAFVQKKIKAKVNLKKFDFELGIEIINGYAYLFNERIRGYGGLPLGVEGKVLCLIEDEKSLLAAWLIMKRGCSIIPLAFRKTDITLLKNFSYGYNLKLNIIKDYKEIEKIATDKNISAVVINDILDSFRDYDTNLCLLRPLISYSEEDVKQKLKEIKNF